MGSSRNLLPLPRNQVHYYGVTKPTLQTQISARLAACREVVSALRISANQIGGLDRLELSALAYRIELCGNPANQFVCNGAVNQDTQETYQARGTLWTCGSKLCPNCLARFAAKHRYQLRRQINRVDLRPKERWHFGTMTIPNPNLSLVATRELVNYAWSLYRKRLLSVSLIRGGAKSEEFTLTANGYHYHLHTLYIAPWHSFMEVRRVWTECVAEAFKQAKLPFKVNNADGLLSVVICRIDGSYCKRCKRTHDISDVPREICKYLTKSDSWYKMPSEHLAEVGLVRRWWRMFELFGCMRAETTSLKTTTTQDVVSESILDTSSLSDGTLPTHSEAWRTVQAKMSLEAYCEFVGQQWARTIYFRQQQIRRRWPHAKLFHATNNGELVTVAEDEREVRATLATVLRNLWSNVEGN